MVGTACLYSCVPGERHSVRSDNGRVFCTVAILFGLRGGRIKLKPSMFVCCRETCVSAPLSNPQKTCRLSQNVKYRPTFKKLHRLWNLVAVVGVLFVKCAVKKAKVFLWSDDFQKISRLDPNSSAGYDQQKSFCWTRMRRTLPSDRC